MQSVERYDYTKNRWLEHVPPMKESHTGEGVLVYGDRISALDSAPQQYNPVTNTWVGSPPNVKGCRR